MADMTDTEMNKPPPRRPLSMRDQSRNLPWSLSMPPMLPLSVTSLAKVLGWPVAYSDEKYAMLTGPSNALGIGTIPDYKRPNWPDDGHKQFHLDLSADDVEAAATRCVEFGAKRADPQPGETWIVLLDPAGHPFCISDAKNWG